MRKALAVAVMAISSLVGLGASHVPTTRQHRAAAPTVWTPQLRGVVTVGNGSVTASYTDNNGVVTFSFDFEAGTTTFYDQDTIFGFSLPVSMASGTNMVEPVYIYDNHGALPGVMRDANIFVSQMYSNATLAPLTTLVMSSTTIVTVAGSYQAST